MLTSEVRPRGLRQFSWLTWGGVGWGGAGMLTFMSSCSQLGCYATTYPVHVDLGWGGVGWGRDVNVHVKLFSTGMLRYNLPPCTLIWGGVGWGRVGWGRDVNVHVKLFSTGMLRYNLPPCTLIWGGVGWGGAGMLTFMSSCSQLGCYATTYPRARWSGVGWGRVGPGF